MSQWTAMVELTVTGVRLEQFINRATQSGMPLENIRRHERTLRAWMPIRHALRLAPVARGLGVKVRFGRRRGIGLQILRLRARGALGAGLAAGILALMILSNQIWAIRIEGAPYRQDEIRAQLYEMGITGGASKMGLNLRDVENGLIARMPDLSWVHCEIRGVRLIVRAVERTVPPVRVGDGTGNLVAARDAVVASIEVYSGTASVKPGEIVRAGQVLIEGVDASGAGVQAMGRVTGRYWAEGTADVSLSMQLQTRTGQTAARVALRAGPYAFVTLDEPGFAQAQTETALVPIVGLFFPVFREKTVQHAVQIRSDLRPLEDAQAEASAAAMVKALEDLPPDATIVDKWVEYSMIKTGVVRAKYTYELTGPLAVAQAE